MKIYMLLMLLAVIVGFSYVPGRRTASARVVPPAQPRPQA